MVHGGVSQEVATDRDDDIETELALGSEEHLKERNLLVFFLEVLLAKRAADLLSSRMNGEFDFSHDDWANIILEMCTDAIDVEKYRFECDDSIAAAFRYRCCDESLGTQPIRLDLYRRLKDKSPNVQLAVILQQFGLSNIHEFVARHEPEIMRRAVEKRTNRAMLQAVH